MIQFDEYDTLYGFQGSSALPLTFDYNHSHVMVFYLVTVENVYEILFLFYKSA